MTRIREEEEVCLVVSTACIALSCAIFETYYIGEYCDLEIQVMGLSPCEFMHNLNIAEIPYIWRVIESKLNTLPYEHMAGNKQKMSRRVSGIDTILLATRLVRLTQLVMARPELLIEVIKALAFAVDRQSVCNSASSRYVTALAVGT